MPYQVAVRRLLCHIKSPLEGNYGMSNLRYKIIIFFLNLRNKIIMHIKSQLHDNYSLSNLCYKIIMAYQIFVTR